MSPTCPICKAPLPSKILKLFFAVEESSIVLPTKSSGSRTSAANGSATDSLDAGAGGLDGTSDHVQGQNLSATEARKLRCEVASTNRVSYNGARERMIERAAGLWAK